MNLIEFAEQRRLQVRRDPADGTDIIPGRKGNSHLFEYGDGLLGVMVMAETATAHWWNSARAAFIAAGMQIRQDGDAEGTATFDPNNPEQVKLALRYAKIRPKRKLSAAHKARLREFAFKEVEDGGLRPPINELGHALEHEKTT